MTLYAVPKRKSYRNKKILVACRDERCLINLPGCTGGGQDSIAAHSNKADDGKGAGIKADDCFVAVACQHCHDVVDGRKALVSPREMEFDKNLIDFYHDRGIKRTIRLMIDKGVRF